MKTLDLLILSTLSILGVNGIYFVDKNIKSNLKVKTKHCPIVFINEWNNFRDYRTDNLYSSLVVFHEIHRTTPENINLRNILTESELKDYGCVNLTLNGWDVIQKKGWTTDDQIKFLQFKKKFDESWSNNSNAVKETNKIESTFNELNFIERMYWNNIVNNYRKNVYRVFN